MELRNLPEKLGCKARIFLKCDDMAPLGGAGNKLRKLEHLMAEAIAQGADTLVTTGGLQSNHARLTAAVAARHGLGCELVLSKLVPRTTENYTENGNVLLMRNFGAKLHILEPGSDSKAYVRQLMRELRMARRKPYFIPFGGSSVMGALGYVECAREINSQLAAQDLRVDQVFCTTGSGGTQAGLVAGFAAAGSTARVQGISVLFPQERIAPVVAGIADGVLMTLGHAPQAYVGSTVLVNDQHVGDGYGIPTQAGLDAIRLLGSTEGIVLDPVYTGKAFAGLLESARQKQCPDQSVVVFVHTGGAPGLYAYADALAEQPAAPNHPVTPPPLKTWARWLFPAVLEPQNGPDTVFDADSGTGNIASVIEEGSNNG